MITDNLLTCPFCGGAAQVVRTKDQSGYWYAECSKCLARHLAYSKDPQEAVSRWNTRFVEVKH